MGISTNLKTEAPSDYDLRDRIKDRHLVYIRKYFKCTIATSKITTAIATKVANTKSSLIDVINGTIEELIAGLYELPEFITLERICAKARRVVNSAYYELIYKNVTRANKKYINADIKKGKLMLRKIIGKNKPKYYKELDALLDEKMQPISLLDIIVIIIKKLGLHDYSASMK